MARNIKSIKMGCDRPYKQWQFSKVLGSEDEYTVGVIDYDGAPRYLSVLNCDSEEVSSSYALVNHPLLSQRLYSPSDDKILCQKWQLIRAPEMRKEGPGYSQDTGENFAIRLAPGCNSTCRGPQYLSKKFKKTQTPYNKVDFKSAIDPEERIKRLYNEVTLENEISQEGFEYWTFEDGKVQ